MNLFSAFNHGCLISALYTRLSSPSKKRALARRVLCSNVTGRVRDANDEPGSLNAKWPFCPTPPKNNRIPPACLIAVSYELKNQGDLKVGTYNAGGWGASRYNCAKQMDALALANGDANADYAKAAKYQMDHILGDNNLGYSFLLGYGSKWPVHIHHRPSGRKS